MNGLDLFSGIGGITLALRPWVRPVAYCENERHAQSILLSRMRSGELPHAPIWDDVRTLRGETLGTWIDIIYGGFPCQDISSAGRGAGMEQGDRSGLFFEILRLTQEIRPAFVFLENVPAIRTRGLSRVLSEFTALGYDSRWTVVSAADVGAPHLRKRWFFLAADTDRPEFRLQPGRGIWTNRKGAPKPLAHAEYYRAGRGFPLESSSESPGNVADINCIGGREGRTRSEIRERQLDHFCGSWWSVEPDLVRVAYGVPHRVDRLRGLGNAVVPLQARVAFERLMFG